MNPTLQLHNISPTPAGISSFCNSRCLHGYWFSGFTSKLPILFTETVLINFFLFISSSLIDFSIRYIYLLKTGYSVCNLIIRITDSPQYIIICSIISTMFLGIGIGYALRNWSILAKTEKTISLYNILVTTLSWEYLLVLTV